MRGILRWLIIIGLFVLVVFLLVNLFNRDSNKQKKKTNDTEPDIYEKSERDIHLFDDSSEQDEVIDSQPILTEETIEVEDTADFNTVGVFIGVFLIAGGIVYIRKKSFQI